MKTIIILLLAAICTVSLFSCSSKAELEAIKSGTNSEHILTTALIKFNDNTKVIIYSDKLMAYDKGDTITAFRRYKEQVWYPSNSSHRNNLHEYKKGIIVKYLVD